jgi:predicted permease
MYQDLRLAFRTLFRRPLFTLAAVTSLALGIGANTVVFSLMDAVVWRPLPVRHPEQLVQIAINNVEGERRPLPWAVCSELRAQNGLFAGVFTRNADGVTFQTDGEAERVVAESVSSNYFSVLGVKAAAGRMFSREVEAGQWQPEVVLSYDYWKWRFNEDPSVVGRSVLVNGYPFTIVGVSEQGFFGIEVGTSFEIRLPMRDSTGEFPALSIVQAPRSAIAFGRLAPEATLQRAQAVAELILKQSLAADRSIGNDPRLRGAHVVVASAARGVQRGRDRLERPLLSLMFAAALLLLVTCINVANLQIARAIGRRREIAVRLALGARASSLVRQLLVESGVLAFLGGLTGFFIALWTSSALVALLPSSHVPVMLAIRPDMRALGFTSAVAFLTGLLFGLIPAVQAAKLDLVSALNNKLTTWVAPGGWRLELGQLFVVLQIAVSMVLLVVAGLFVRTLGNLEAVNPGFRAESLALFTMKHVHERYTPEQIRGFCLELVRRVSSLPGVRAAALSEAGPFTGRAGGRLASAPGSDRTVQVTLDRAGPGLFGTLGMPVLLGREFTPQDEEGRPPVAVIDTDTARELFAAESPLGRTIRLEGRSRSGTYEVVGVIQAVRQVSLRESHRSVYVPILQGSLPLMPTLYVRARSDAASIMTPVRRVFLDLDPELAVFHVKTMRRQIEESLSTERLTARLSAAFGSLGLVMVFVGILGVMALSVARRTRDIGIRMALGAASSHLKWSLIRDTLRLLLLGTLLGVPASLAAGRVATAQLFGVAPHDPVTIAAVILVMGMAAVLAAFVPALQATRVDPNIVLRSE